MKRFLQIIAVLVLCIYSCFAQSIREIPTEQSYVASTSWVASIAQLAGIDDVVTIAPANLKHPPEYEITPDDVYVIANAKLFMQAGYERMMKTLSNAAELDQSRILKVKTTNTYENLKNMVTMLSEKAGTQDKAAIRFSKVEQMILDARERISKSSNKDIEVFAHKDQVEFAKDLGLNVVSVFGSSQLTSDQIAEAAEKKYALVLDNYHSPLADPIAQVSLESRILVFRNFPDSPGNDALYNVIKGNLEMLWATGLF